MSLRDKLCLELSLSALLALYHCFVLIPRGPLPTPTPRRGIISW